ncbi:MAG: D-lyxose/D-mannose family sugar isomerase [Oscillospiraceae bacterium]|nr:D-lyxose/D-mannose family sugar isomerase [Oscillospiraceae bacterium]
MKRSEINKALTWAKALLEKYNIRLPDFAYWTMDEWKAHKEEIGAIRATMQGWDITDYGTGRYDEIGCVLFTVRNGVQGDDSVGVPYCEKYLLFKEGQRLPQHYHVFKTEDIIVRAGGDMAIRLYSCDKNGKILDEPVRIFCDGIPHTYACGEEFVVKPGNSVTLTPYMAHIFGTKAGTGDLICGEVSKVNDDNTDNFFLESTSRFADIEEDVPILHPLCNEYDKVL